MISNEFYQYEVNERRRLLADQGFARDDLRVWTHRDGRSIGEGVAMALTDVAFFRYLGIEPPDDGLTSAETAESEEILELG